MKRLKVFNNLRIKIFTTTFFVFVLFFYSLAFSASAARLDLLPTNNNVKVGDIFKVRIILSSPSSSANAISGNLSFSNNLLSLTSLSKSNSAISLWPVEPTYSNSSGTVNFEGVILNGYTGNNATILTLNFRAKANGTAQVNFSQGSVLANDGAGTPLATSLGDTQVNITENFARDVPVVNTIKDVPVKVTKTYNASITIEELKKKDELDSRSRFLITSVNKKPNIPYKIEIDDSPYVWDDASDHVFETGPLSRGIHTIKVYMETLGGESISKTLSFSNTGIHTPVFTDFSNKVLENEYIVIKGTADPLAFVKIDSDFVSQSYDTKHDSTTIKANEKGEFTYVSQERGVLGIYSFVASAQSSDGIESDKTAPIKIAVTGANVSWFKKIASTLAIVIPLMAMLVLFILFVIYSWYKIRNYKEVLRKRLLKTIQTVDDEFKIIEKDLGKENQIIEKAKASEPLSDDDLGFIKVFKKDLNEAERIIEQDIKDSSK